MLSTPMSLMMATFVISLYLKVFLTAHEFICKVAIQLTEISPVSPSLSRLDAFHDSNNEVPLHSIVFSCAATKSKILASEFIYFLYKR